MKHFNPFDGSPQAHVDVMGSSLKLEDGTLLPLIQHNLPRIDKPQKAHQREKTRDRQE
jgi:hypothetical protein